MFNKSLFSPIHDSRFTIHDKKGFTLLEVLITIGLIALVIGLVYTTLYLSSISVRDSRIKNQKTAELLKIYSQLRHQLLGLYYIPEKDMCIKAELTPSGETDLIFFTTSGIFYPTTTQVEYQILKDKTEKPYLAYEELPYPECFRQQTQKPKVLSKNITSFKVEFYQDNLWIDKWDKNTPPEKIRLILRYKDSEEKFSFIVRPGISLLSR